MRLEKKDVLLLIPATLLAVAGLGPDDPWVIGPCLLLSWFSFLIICAIHTGSRKARISIAAGITLLLGSAGYRRFHSIYEATADRPRPARIPSPEEYAREVWKEKPIDKSQAQNDKASQEVPNKVAANRASPLRLELAPYALLYREHYKIGGEEVNGVKYGIAGILRAENTGNQSQYIRALEVTGDAPADYSIYEMDFGEVGLT